MKLFRFIEEHRPIVILSLVVFLSLASLISGTQASFLQTGIRRVVSLTAYPFLEARTFVSDTSHYTYNFIFSYREISREEDDLKNENMQLREKLTQRAEVNEENKRLRGMLNFQRGESRLTLMPAKIIGGSQGLLEIDRGAHHGMKEALCVLTEKGVVGMVIEVHDLSSMVATLHHPKCVVGAMVRRNRIRAYDGVIHASGSLLTTICTMDYIETRDRDAVGKGDFVVTSPESLFPSGYPIGVITAVHGGDSLWKTADVAPSVDPYSLDEVFIVLNDTPAADELEGPNAPDTPDMAPLLPESLPLQERYSP